MGPRQGCVRGSPRPARPALDASSGGARAGRPGRSRGLGPALWDGAGNGLGPARNARGGRSRDACRNRPASPRAAGAVAFVRRLRPGRRWSGGHGRCGWRSWGLRTAVRRRERPRQVKGGASRPTGRPPSRQPRPWDGTGAAPAGGCTIHAEHPPSGRLANGAGTSSGWGILVRPASGAGGSRAVGAAALRARLPTARRITGAAASRVSPPSPRRTGASSTPGLGTEPRRAAFSTHSPPFADPCP